MVNFDGKICIDDVLKRKAQALDGGNKIQLVRFEF